MKALYFQAMAVILGFGIGEAAMAQSAPPFDQRKAAVAQFHKLVAERGMEALYQDGMQHCLKSVLLTGAAIRKTVIEEVLYYAAGEKAQVLRLLYWARETDAALRMEILRQWLTEKNDGLSAASVQADLMKLLPYRSPESVAKRNAEIEEVFAGLPTEREKRANKMLPPIVGEHTSCRALDALTEAALFRDVAVRDAVVQELCGQPVPPDDLAQREVTAGIIALLWLTERNETNVASLENRLVNTVVLYNVGSLSGRDFAGHLLVEFEEGHRKNIVTRLDSALARKRPPLIAPRER